MRGGECILEDNIELRRGTYLKVDGRFHMEAGPGTGLTYNCTVHCGKSIRIGRFSTIAEYSSLYDGEHKHTLDPDRSFYVASDNVYAPIEIGRNCYIGAKVSIMKGVTIGDCCIIANGAVVNRDVPP